MTSFAKEIYVVPTDFPTIQGAIDFAVNGDVVLVDPVNGPYAGFVLDTSNLSLVENCAGEVVLDNMHFIHSLIGLQITDSEDVALSNVLAAGGVASLVNSPTVRIFGSNVRIDDSDITGGKNIIFTGIGLDAVAAHDSLVVISNSTLRGGNAPISGQSGGNGLTLYVGSHAILVGDDADEVVGGEGLDGGADGFAVELWEGCSMSYGTVNMGTIDGPAAAAAIFDGNLPYLEVSGDLVPGGNVNLDAESVFPDARALVLISTFSGVNRNFQLPLVFSDQGASFVATTASDGNGHVDVDFIIPESDIFQGFRFVAQTGFVSPQGVFLTNAIDRLIAGF